MDRRKMNSLRRGDKIRFKRGMVNAGLTATFLRVIPSDSQCGLLDRIEYEFGGRPPTSLPHDRFTSA